MINSTITSHGFIGNLGRGAAPRELECLMAVAAGLTTKEAAKDLGLAPDSFNKRLLALTTKLGVTRRAQLVAMAFAQGIISFACAAPADPDPQHDREQDQHQGVFVA